MTCLFDKTERSQEKAGGYNEGMHELQVLGKN
jgi:hypothetical protein